MPWLRRLGLCGLLLLAWPASANAHAVLVASEPRDGQRLDEPPARARLIFNEPVRVLALRLIDGGGRQRPVEGPARAIGETVAATLPDLPPGAYVLSYRIASADGHPVGGSILFRVGQSAAEEPGSVGSAAAETAWRMASALARFAVYAALLLAAGGALFNALVLVAREADSSAHRRDLRRACLAAAAALVAATGVEGGLAALGSVGALLEFRTWGLGASGPAGVSAGTSLAGLLLIAVARRQTLVIAGAVVAAAGLAFTGHAATAQPRGLAFAAVATHVLAAAYWIGALLPLRRALGRAPLAEAAAITLRFSRLAVVIVAILVVAGVLLAILQLRGLRPLWETSYGQLLLAKIGFVAALVGLATWNKWRLTPALVRGEKAAALALRRSIALEIVVAMAVLALTASLAAVPPPRAQATAAPSADHAAHGHHAGHREHPARGGAPARGAREFVIPSPPYEAHVSLAFGGAGLPTIVVRLVRGNGQALDAQEVDLSLSVPTAGIEPLTRRMVRRATGEFAFSGVELSLPGPWRLRIEALVGDFEKAVFERDDLSP
jgi:copper transport protein